MSNTLFRSLGLIEPGDLVQYHGSLTDAHGLYLAYPCTCPPCRNADKFGDRDTRYLLMDPFDADEEGLLRVALVCAGRPSITLANG